MDWAIGLGMFEDTWWDDNPDNTWWDDNPDDTWWDDNPDDTWYWPKEKKMLESDPQIRFVPYEPNNPKTTSSQDQVADECVMVYENTRTELKERYFFYISKTLDGSYEVHDHWVLSKTNDNDPWTSVE